MAKEQGLRKAACVIDEMLSAKGDNSFSPFPAALAKPNECQSEFVFKAL